MVNFKLNILNSCSSTNDIAMEAALNGEMEGASYLSYNQTNGRGRNNNKWTSMNGNLFLSTIIKPKSNKSCWHQLSLIVGLSILDVLLEMGLKKDIIEFKWPNDVLVDKKKISGVLLASTNNFVIIGMGLNILKVPALERKWKTAKLNDYVDKNISVENIGLKILKKLFFNYNVWENYGFNVFYNRINTHIKNINDPITLKAPAKIKLINGIFLGLGQNGGLKIKNNNNIFEYFIVDSFYFPKEQIE